MPRSVTAARSDGRPRPDGRRPLAALLLMCAACGGASGPTPCDGMAGRTVAVTKVDYAQCAGEILATLEAMETPLRRYVNGDQAAKSEAASAYRQLKHLMREVGFQADALREVRGGAGRTVERWPDAGMRAFNAEIIRAAAQFGSALVHPNQDNLQQGARSHAQARSAYARFR